MKTDPRLVRRFWDGITLRQLAPLLGAALFTFAGQILNPDSRDDSRFKI